MRNMLVAPFTRNACRKCDSTLVRVPRNLILAGLGMLAVAACGTVPFESELPPLPFALQVQSGKAGEECFELARGERISYQFEASVALEFNLHTHRAGRVVTPVLVAGTQEQAGTFTAPYVGEYCMTWTNRRSVPAAIKGQWRRLR